MNWKRAPRQIRWYDWLRMPGIILGLFWAVWKQAKTDRRSGHGYSTGKRNDSDY